MKKGFTLIELLMVIAIIGILVSIVVVSTSGVTDSARDTRVQGDASQIINLAQLVKNSDDSYDALCLAAGNATSLNASHPIYGKELTILQDDIDKNADVGVDQADRTDCNASDFTWCYGIRLRGGAYWCVDDVGKAISTTPGICDPSNISCY